MRLHYVSKVTVEKRLRTLIDEAEAELTISVPKAILEVIRPALKRAIDRGVLVLLIVSGTTEPPEHADSIASVTRIWRELMPTLVTVDRRLGLVAPAEMLVRSNTDFRRAVFQSTLWLWSDSALRAEVTVRDTKTDEPVTVEGRVVEVVQGLASPTNNMFPVENSLTIETDDGDAVAIGGQGAFVEDIEAESITLRLA